MTGNIPSLFSIVQGVKAQASKAAAPMTHIMPDGSVMDGPPMDYSNIPGRMDGGDVSVAGYEEGAMYGPPDPNASSGGGTQGNGGGGTGAPPASLVYSYIDWAGIKTGDPDEDYQRASAAVAAGLSGGDPYFQGFLNAVNKSASGSGGSDGAAYAGIAERAQEAANQLAFNREQESHKMAEARQSVAALQEKAMQDFFTNREMLKTQRAQLHNTAVTDALNAWSQNVGHANIPGIENYSLAGGQGAEAAVQGARPKLQFNPMAAYGTAPQWEEGAAPNIPGIDYGQAA